MAYTFRHGDRPLDDFTIQRAVGSGGFGEVYYAVSDGGREVGLKYLKQNPQIELRGVSHCINLKSPHLVAIFDVKKNADDEYFVIMEYCSGPSLRDLLIAEPNGFEPQKAVFFVREIAKGLSYLHERGIVHRDLKPGNIFYDDGYVKIGDYGLSKFISVSRHSAQTSSVGTVHYMAPEIGSGNYSRGVDIYALGVMLYEMLLGKVPFEGSSMAEVLMKHLTAQPELDELPHPFGAVIRKALEKDPKDRYQSVDEMVDALLEVEDVKQSLAGFSPQSLDGAVYRGGGVGEARSPMPSPNPPPSPGPPFAKPAAAQYRATRLPFQPRADVPLTGKQAKKVDRVSRKVEKRMQRLGKRGHKLAQPPVDRAERAS
ncbi:MAG: serine/threonine protein kinase, partial [Planctomycetes bacterium]|nr:serine/threonine protein kinase [Planctomycetota bacterium]